MTMDPGPTIAPIVDNPAMSRFELDLGGDAQAVVYYRLEGDRLTIVHTEVPFPFSGQGIGSRLAAAVMMEAQRRGLKVIARCPFFSAWLARHPEYAGLVEG